MFVTSYLPKHGGHLHSAIFSHFISEYVKQKFVYPALCWAESSPLRHIFPSSHSLFAPVHVILPIPQRKDTFGGSTHCAVYLIVCNVLYKYRVLYNFCSSHATIKLLFLSHSYFSVDTPCFPVMRNRTLQINKKMPAFWYILPYGLVKTFERFGRQQCHHLSRV
jgi:hypothetical protein